MGFNLATHTTLVTSCMQETLCRFILCYAVLAFFSLNKICAIKEKRLKRWFLQTMQFGQSTSAAENSRVQWVYPNSMYQVNVLCSFFTVNFSDEHIH
jgi:hypothetical protein